LKWSDKKIVWIDKVEIIETDDDGNDVVVKRQGPTMNGCFITEWDEAGRSALLWDPNGIELVEKWHAEHEAPKVPYPKSDFRGVGRGRNIKNAVQ